MPEEIDLTLEKAHLDWMGSMAQKYSLPTPDKALRIAILYMKQTKGLEQTVFKEIKLPAKQNEITMKHTLDKVHWNYLDEVGEKYSLAGKDVAAQILLNYEMSNVNEKTLFETILCKHGADCNHCKSK